MRYLSLIITLCATLIMTSCSKEETPEVEVEKMVEIALIADVGDDTRLGIEGNKTFWEEGDRISVALVVNYYSMTYIEMEITSAIDISTDGKRATFRGSVPEGNYYGVTALYPAQSINFNETTLDRNAVDNIYMISRVASNVSPVFTVTSGQNVEVPITFTHLMHKMDINLSLASGYVSNDLNSNNIAVEVSATSNGAPMAFCQKQTLNMRSNTTSVTESSEQFMVYGTNTSLSTMLFPLNTTTNIALTFGVYIDGEKRYEIVKGPYSSLRMSAGKTTTVNLTLSESNSVTGGGEIVAEPIILSASKSTIKANGTESATLSVVTENGEDVTLQSTIYVDGTQLNGTTFSTTSPGIYTLYAERNGLRSNELTITAEEVANTGKTIVFADGVTLTSGWYDVNKFKEGNNGDIQMCWAASASNIIQWWQDRYVAQGGTLPSTAINGPSTKTYSIGCQYQLALMDMFHSEWDNSYGGHVNEAVPWYFEGKLYGGEYASPGSQATPKSAGGYWSSVWSSVEPYIYRGYSHDLFTSQYPNMYTYSYNNYYIWGNGTSLTGTDRLAKFTELVVQTFERGMASLTISLASNIYSLHHATTLWGYEIDNATGLLTRVWLTDSDDLTTEPKSPILHEYTVSIGSGTSHIQLSCDQVRYKNVWVVSLVPVSGPNLGR